jgi:hypothetical protein
MTILLRPIHFAKKRVSFIFVARGVKSNAFAEQSNDGLEVQCYSVPDFQQVKHLAKWIEDSFQLLLTSFSPEAVLQLWQ